MAFSYLPVDRDQPFLLPPDVREWLPEGHLAWFVIDAVEQVDTAALHARHPRQGVGRRAYDPEMLLALLIYAYCTGQSSSRQIEQLCEVDVAYRVICANHVPDHTTIARFRQVFTDQVVVLFADVLEMCAAAGMVKVGVVAVDGTKFAADASLRANRTRARLEAEIRSLLAEAERVDADEDAQFGDGRGDEPPDDLADRRKRRVRLAEAAAELRRRRQARQAAADDKVAAAEAHLARVRSARARRRAATEAAAAAKGRRPGGPPPSTGGPPVRRAEANVAKARAAAAATADGDCDERVNVTDLDSRIMPVAGGGWVQGYNAQAAVSEDGIVVAADVTQDISDTLWCEPMTDAATDNLADAGINEPVGTFLFDAGYWSNANGANVTDDDQGRPSRLISTTKSYKQRQQLRDQGPATGAPPPGASPAEAMEHRLRTPEGQALYAKRQHTVEPVFGDIKHRRGLRRFARRGLTAVRAEWQLITATHNLVKLHHHRLASS